MDTGASAGARQSDRWLAARLEEGETVDLHDRLTHLVGMNMAGDIIGVPARRAQPGPGCLPRPGPVRPVRNTSRMVTLGHGIHHCLGANLARTECAVVLVEVRRELPGLSLAERPVFRTSMSLRTLERFPVVLDS